MPRDRFAEPEALVEFTLQKQEAAGSNAGTIVGEKLERLGFDLVGPVADSLAPIPSLACGRKPTQKRVESKVAVKGLKDRIEA